MAGTRRRVGNQRRSDERRSFPGLAAQDAPRVDGYRLVTAPPVPHEGTFPKLTDEQRARIAVFARERRFSDGELLWDQGDDGRPLYVVLEGKITILSGADVFVTAHEPGQFSGDVDMLAGRPAVVRGRAAGDTRVLELPAPRLRSLVQTDPELSEIFLKAFIYRRLLLQSEHAESIVLIGSRHSAGTLLLEDFLTRNGQPFTYLDVDRDPDAQKTLDALNVGVDDVPVLICRGSRVLKRPTIEEAGECLGLNRLDTATVHDVVVVGAGPGGLAAAVYAASEGLDVVVVEANAPGGQAGSSSKIENYLGFPLGISGEELANRAFIQAQKFGASIAVAREAVAPRVRTATVRDRARRRPAHQGAHRDPRDRREVSETRPAGPREIRGSRGLLRSDPVRGEPLRGP